MTARRAAMVLAAGFGTRMGALTRDRPKPLIEVAGRPLIAHAIAAAGTGDPIVVNGHYRADALRDHLDRHHPGVRFSLEQPRILDSGGAVKQALPLLGRDPILTLNADAVWRGPVPHEVLDAAWRPERMAALLLLVPRDRATGRIGGGDFAMTPDHRLSWDRGTTSWVYTGAQILDTRAIAARPDRVFSLRDIWQHAMGEGRLYGCVYPGAWADVGHPEGIVEAEAMLNEAA